MAKIKILVVDDSVVGRRLLSNLLDGDPDLEVVGTAPNRKIALAKISQVSPDLIVLDAEMPEISSLEMLAAIREQSKNIPVIMFGAIAELGASATLDALSLGGTDYVTVPHKINRNEVAIQQLREQLITKIKKLAKGGFTPNLGFLKISETTDKPAENQPNSISFHSGFNNIKSQVEIVAFGVSTGGPNALETVLEKLPADFRVPIVIVQHMPPVFTTRLAARLDQKCQIRVQEAATGAILEPGVAWIAPGDYHMVLEKRGFAVQIRTNQEPLENSCRPAVDVLFRSTAKIYRAGVLAVMLTGMGQDGLVGCQNIREAGGRVIVQDEATSVVWGMPGSVANAGLADRVIPLDKIAGEIIDRVNSQ